MSVPAAPAPAPADAPAPAGAPAAPAPPSGAPVPAPKPDGEGSPPPNFEVAPPPTPDAPQDVVVEYNPTGDTSLDLALQFVGERGFGPERDDMKAAMTGDFSKLEASLKALGDKAKGYERYLAAAKESFKRTQETKAAREAQIVKTIEDAVGGAGNWKAIHAWVSAEADEGQKKEITAAFAAGSYAAAAMARQLADLYRQSGKSTLPPKSATQDSAASAPASSGGAIDSTTFKLEMRKLEAKYGYRLTNTQEYADLVARRRAYTK